MTWDLPLDVEIDGEKHAIRNKCDYRVVLDVICAILDADLTDEERLGCALTIFYEDVSKISDIETATKEMMRIIDCGQEEKSAGEKPRVMDWEYDFQLLAPPVSRVLGYDVRTPDKYTHWYTFVGAYMEIGDCTFTNIVSIRNKRAKGQKLEKWEMDYFRENRDKIILPPRLTAEEKAWLDF